MLYYILILLSCTCKSLVYFSRCNVAVSVNVLFLICAVKTGDACLVSEMRHGDAVSISAFITIVIDHFNDCIIDYDMNNRVTWSQKWQLNISYKKMCYSRNW